MTDPTPRPLRLRRRGLAVAGLAAAAVLAGPRLVPGLWPRLAPGPDLVPDPVLPGFRRLDGLAVTAGPPALAGIGADPAPEAGPLACADLFPGGVIPGRVPVAVFTDINCPHCRVMEPWLTGLPADRVTLSWHDLPLLGPASDAGARAIIAAGAQGAEAQLRDRLHRSRFVPDAAYLTALATDAGLDPDRLLAEMAAPATTARLAASVALARRLGLAGTPALVIGDIIAPGRLERAELDALIAMAGPPPCV